MCYYVHIKSLKYRGSVEMQDMIWCVSWYNEHGERRIEWNVPDPFWLKERLIEDGIPEEKIDVYEKDVS
jgi:hypothetical protein